MINKEINIKRVANIERAIIKHIDLFVKNEQGENHIDTLVTENIFDVNKRIQRVIKYVDKGNELLDTIYSNIYKYDKVEDLYPSLFSQTKWFRSRYETNRKYQEYEVEYDDKGRIESYTEKNDQGNRNKTSFTYLDINEKQAPSIPKSLISLTLPPFIVYYPFTFETCTKSTIINDQERITEIRTFKFQ